MRKAVWLLGLVAILVPSVSFAQPMQCKECIDEEVEGKLYHHFEGDVGSTGRDCANSTEGGHTVGCDDDAWHVRPCDLHATCGSLAALEAAFKLSPGNILAARELEKKYAQFIRVDATLGRIEVRDCGGLLIALVDE